MKYTVQKEGSEGVTICRSDRKNKEVGKDRERFTRGFRSISEEVGSIEKNSVGVMLVFFRSHIQRD